MAGNEDASPMSIEDAILASGGAVEETQESTEQQATEGATTTEEASTETQTQTTSGETQEESSTTEEATTTEASETEATTDSDIIDLNTESETTTEEGTESETTNPINFGEILGGEFESEEDIASYLDEVHTRIEELEKANEPKFANETVQKLNEYVQAGGTAANFMKVQGVNLDTMSPVEKLTTQIAWNNPNLSEAKAREFVREKYGLSDDEDGSDNAQAVIDSNQAAADIKKIQADDTPGKVAGLSEEEWNNKLAETQKASEEARYQQDAARMEEWNKPIGETFNTLKEKGIVIDLGNGKGFKYAFTADEKYIKDLTTQVEEALYLSGTSVKENPKLAQQMIEMQYKNDNFDKIVKAFGTKMANSTNEQWFKDVTNPSPIKRGDAAPKENATLPTAEEAMRKVFEQ